MYTLTYYYFSATAATEGCAFAVGDAMRIPLKESFNIADALPAVTPEFSVGDVVIVAAPVYGGRLPAMAADAFRHLKGNGANAVAIVVYGNRDYDDALLELTDILAEAGFFIIGAGAFIGQHSIFPKVGAGRPDEADMEELRKFGEACGAVLSVDNKAEATAAKGMRPYKKSAGVPLHPECDAKKCTRCSTCADKCPTKAISPSNPTITDNARCISCGRCIYVCPQEARGYRGMKYAAIGAVFGAGFSRRKDPEWSVAK